jgi:hypothetical protein
VSEARTTIQRRCCCRCLAPPTAAFCTICSAAVTAAL